MSPDSRARSKLPRRLHAAADEPAADRLSQLPDPILARIISLIPTREAVRLSVLSTRWNGLWTQTSRLDFADDGLPLPRRSCKRKTAFIDRCLILHERPAISTFRFANYFHSIRNFPTDQQLDSWVLFAVRRGVETLWLHLEYRTPKYRLPRRLYWSRTLRSLDLSYCVLNFPPPGSRSLALASLATIKLRRVDMRNDELTTHISSCPSLHSLFLDNCSRDGHLRVLAECSRMEELQITGSCSDLEIFAPSVTALSIFISAFMGFTGEYAMVDLSSLRTVSFSSMPESFLSRFDPSIHSGTCVAFLQQVGHARELHLYSSIQALSFAEVHGHATFSCNASSLSLNMEFNKVEIPGLGYILRCFGEMERLTIKVNYLTTVTSGFYDKDDILSSLNDHSYWESFDSSCQASLQSLKTITIDHTYEYYLTSSAVNNLVQNQDNEIRFLLFILKRAPALDTLNFHFRKDDNSSKRSKILL